MEAGRAAAAADTLGATGAAEGVPLDDACAELAFLRGDDADRGFCRASVGCITRGDTAIVNKLLSFVSNCLLFMRVIEG